MSLCPSDGEAIYPGDIMKVIKWIAVFWFVVVPVLIIVVSVIDYWTSRH